MKNKNIIIARKSISLEKDPNERVLALIVAGKRYVVNDGRIKICEQIAENIVLNDLDFDIVIDFEDQGKNGLIFDSIFKIPTNQWSVIMMIRYSLADWDVKRSLSGYANQIVEAINKREISHGDVIGRIIHICLDHFCLWFSIKGFGATIKEALEDARMMANRFIPPL